MKLDNKTINIVAGVIFLWRAFKSVTSFISNAASGVLFYIGPFHLVMTVYGIVVLSIMGINALHQKKRGKLLNGFGIVYIGYDLVNILTSLPYSLNVRSLSYFAVLVAAFIYSQKACGGSVFDTSDTVSEAAKIQIQAQKQTAIYDEQLRDGILTQEEYDQIMKAKN